MPYTYSFLAPADMLVVADKDTQGYSSAAKVPAGVPSTMGAALVEAVLHAASEKKRTV